MAAYMPQPDSGNTCCDCPDRTSPCDDCTQTGACCVGTDCAITTEDDCTGMGGTFLGIDRLCDPNPCACPCSFTNPDDGLHYLTKHYINTVISDCPPDETWLTFGGASVNTDCSPSLWHAPDCFTHGTRTVSYLLTETYNEACEVVTTNEDVVIPTYCNCAETSAIIDPVTCGGVFKPHCPLHDCPCETPPVPPFRADCGGVMTTVVYEDRCNPTGAAFSPSP